MAGRRLLDVAALFNASRGVAKKHVALRSRQLDVYNRTSTISRAVRNQTERVTETVKAASILASRLNENAPAWTYDLKENDVAIPKHSEEPIPSKESTEGAPEYVAKEGIDQDHHWEQSPAESSVDAVPEEDLKVQQEKPVRYPSPDGTIPPEDFNERGKTINTDSPSVRPNDEPSQKPLEDRGLKPKSSGASTIPDPTQTSRTHLSSQAARLAQRVSEFQIPSKTADAFDDSVDTKLEGHDEESFFKPSTHTSESLSSLPRAKIPKHPSGTQGPENLEEGELNPDTFYSASGSKSPLRIEPVETDEEVPEGVNLDIFYNPRTAKKLGGRTQNNGVGLGIGNTVSKPHPLDDRITLAPKYKEGGPIEAPETTKRNSVNVEEPLDEGHPQNDIKQSKVELGPRAAPYELRESKVPSSRLGRLWNYGGLAAGMFGGAVTESLRRVGGGGGEGSFMLSAGNMQRLVSKLSRMRGAALKLGQMISFQDSKMLPAPIQEVLQRVQDRADYMPASQRDKVMAANLGPDWRDLFSSFEEKPIAAASIGQVHSAVLKSTGQKVAVKVQYPGVAGSIDSDLNNLAILLTASRLLPKGLFLDKTIANARTELGWECDYIREAECGRRFHELLSDETETFVVPRVFPEASGQQVLTMEFLEGVGVTQVKSFTQEQRDWIGTQILRLCLREITEFKYMQTDPNWTNFLYNASTNKLELLDFGASREYPSEFIDLYTRLLLAASVADKTSLRSLSIELGYLTGHESKAMLDAHIASIITLAEPFVDSSPEVYDFKDQTITERVKALIPVMIRERLAPPPEETYSLHRKLSGAFLLCARLGARVRCKELFRDSMVKADLL